MDVYPKREKSKKVILWKSRKAGTDLCGEFSVKSHKFATKLNFALMLNLTESSSWTSKEEWEFENLKSSKNSNLKEIKHFVKSPKWIIFWSDYVFVFCFYYTSELIQKFNMKLKVDSR